MFIDIEKQKDLVVELDADSMVYKIGNTIDMQANHGKRLACQLVDDAVSRIYEDTGCRKVIIYLGTETNYRKQVATLQKYKGNRDNSERPQFYDAIRAWMVSEYGALLIDGEEAEDAVGIACYKYKNVDNVMVAAIDKDMRMIPGWHYNYVNFKVDYVTPLQALRNFYLQLLTGDSTDNIPGLYKQLLLDKEDELAHKFRYSRPGYKKALIQDLESCQTEIDMFRAVLSRYDNYGQIEKHGMDRIREIGQLLWIRRYPDEMWVPPCERGFNYLDNDGRVYNVEANQEV